MSNLVIATNKYWYNDDGLLHRLDGPAVEVVAVYKAWYVNGKLHRLNGPAIEDADGSKEWWVNNKLHRLDGPAIEVVDGTKSWYIDGNNIVESDYPKAVLLFKCKIVLES